MSRPLQTARNSVGILKKLVVGWVLIAGMVVYSLLVGCTQMYNWAAPRTQRAVTAVSEGGIRTSLRESFERTGR